MRKESKKTKVAVAMSGGVDSSVAAFILQKKGFEVFGVFMDLWSADKDIIKKHENDFLQAKEIAKLLGIKLYRLNVKAEFKKRVVGNFLCEYEKCRTPNPCVVCNKYIKFSWLVDQVVNKFGADFLATGHYARIKQSGFGRKKKFRLLRGKDKNKDQSYFLYNLNQKNLSRIIFPLGGKTKTEAKNIARKNSMPVYNRQESQEICFVGNDYRELLKKLIKKDLRPGGRIVDEDGKDLKAKHNGLPLYTIGQRSGIGLSGGPWYVSGFNLKKNELIVTKKPAESNIYGKQLYCRQVNWVGDKPKTPYRCLAQIRYRSKPVTAKIFIDRSRYRVIFAKKQRAITSGQSIVFYKKDEVIGGGVID